MRKLCLCIGALVCMTWGCSDNKPESHLIECPENQICIDKSELTIYYDRPGEMTAFYNGQTNTGVLLTTEDNECAEFTKNSYITDKDGYASLVMKAKVENCSSDKKVRICVANNPEICAEITVHTASDNNNSDINHEDDVNHEDDNKPESPITECPENQLCIDKSELTIYYGRQVELTVVYNGQTNTGVSLTTEDNECAEFTQDSYVTDKDGYASLSMKAKVENCTSDKNVKICVANNPEICAEIAVNTASDNKKLDANGNRMIEAFETNTDKDKYTNKMYKSGDCTSYCRSDDDCEDFCDSAMGYRCSTRCKSDDQCISIQDGDGSWKSMICRDDGRCAYPEFKFIYNITKEAGAEVTMGGQPYNANDKVTIDWGDGTKEKVPGTTNNDLKHQYTKKGEYTVTITGDYRNWTAGCITNKGIELADVLQFGPVGLGHNDVFEDGEYQYGSFTGCKTLEKMSADDIPDASKMVDMSSMFSGLDPVEKGVFMAIADEKIALWDTSYAKSLYRVFFNCNKFNQDIGRWNVSNAESLRDMFDSAEKFNTYIGCWNVENVKNISGMFQSAFDFNQNLENWKFQSTPKHDKVLFTENSNYGEIGLLNYCRIRHLVNDGNIGRESGGGSTVNGIHKGKTCCGISGFSSGETTMCDPGLNYEDACDATNGKTAEDYVNACLNNYLIKRSGYKKVFYDIKKSSDGESLYIECDKCNSESGWRNEPIKDADTVTCHHLRTCRDCYGKCLTCIDACKEEKLGSDTECESYCTNITCYKDCTESAFKSCNDKYTNANSDDNMRCKSEAASTCRDVTCKDKAPFYDTDSTKKQRIDKYCSCEGMAGRKPLGK